MKKRLLAILLILSLLIPFCSVPVHAAGTYGTVPILIGNAEVDYMAEQLLAQIPTAGKSAAGQIQAVYDWIVANCKRNGWDGTYYYDSQAISSAAQSYYASMRQQVDAGKAVIRIEMEKYWNVKGESGGSYTIDSNQYVAYMAQDMMLKRTGDCTNFCGLFTVLLGHLGFDCRMIGGDFINNDGSHAMHKWNYVLIDGAYYWFDVRMDHAAVSWYGYNPHEYFMIGSTPLWEADHEWDHSYSNMLAAYPSTVINAYNQALASAAALPTVDYSAGSLSNYQKTRSYYEGLFSDVHSGDWFAQDVQRTYEYGLLQGYDNGRFGVGDKLTIAQTLAIADRLHNIYYGGTGVFIQGEPWYQVYVDYAEKYDIIYHGQYDPRAVATRADFAVILSSALPDAALPAINYVQRIPDVEYYSNYGYHVYRLYDAGILTGNDAYGTFAPDTPIKREQVAAMAARFADPSLRKTVNLRDPDPVVPDPVNPQPGELEWTRIDEGIGVMNYGDIDVLFTDWFYLELPSTLPWTCYYGDDEGTTISFYYSPALESDGPYDGRFLTIRAFDHDDLEYMNYPQWCVAESDRFKTYVAIFPSDVRVDLSDPVQREEYSELLQWVYMLETDDSLFTVLYP